MKRALVVLSLLFLTACSGPSEKDTNPPESPLPAPRNSAVPTLLPEPERPRELSGGEVYRRLLRSTVFIQTKDGFGSGVLIDSGRRFVLTNSHVVEDEKKVSVYFPAYDNKDQEIGDWKYYENRKETIGLAGAVVANSPRRDLALIRLASLPEDVRPVSISKQPAATGNPVFSVGGSGVKDDQLWRLTTGTVRARFKKEYRDEDAFREYMRLETQSPNNKGDSGGPVVNGRVELVGIVAAVSAKDRLVSINVDVTEIRDFVGEHFRSIRETWSESETELESSPSLPGSTVAFDNLLAVLKGGVPTDRVAAARRLGNLRAQARAAVPALLTAIEGASEELQTVIAAALTQIGAPESGAEKVLIEALRSKSLVARFYALKLFAADTPVPSDAVKVITGMLRDESSETRALAAVAIGKTGPRGRPVALASLLERLADSDPSVREHAVSALKLIGPPDRAEKDVLLRLMKHPDIRIRMESLTLLGPLAKTPEDVRSIWLPLLKDSDSQLRLTVIPLIGRLGESVRPLALGPLLELLADADQPVRDAATAALKSLGSPGREEQNVLLALIEHDDIRIRVAALTLLRPLATTSADVRSIWLPLLKDSDSQLRLASVTALTATSDLVVSVEKEIVPFLSDSDPAIRLIVARAVKAVKDRSGTSDRLIKCLESETDTKIKEALAESLIGLTAADAGALSLFRRFLRDPSATVRESATRKIAEIAPEATAAIPDLIERLGDEADPVRIASLTALGAMGSDAKAAIIPASKLFDRRTPEPVLVAAVKMLGATGSEGIARLETHCQKAHPSTVAEEMCRSFSRAKSTESATRVWMIEQAETLISCREAITEAVAKEVTKAEIQELLRRTLPIKPRQPGEKAVTNPADYRVWAIITLRKLDLSGSAMRETRGMVIDRLNLFVTSNTDAEVIAEAKAALTVLKK